MKQILFVCTGNTCRSSMALGIFKQILGDDSSFVCDSAGFMVSKDAKASDAAIKACNEIGVDISNHKAKSITSIKNLESIDLFVVMTELHAEVLRQLNVKDENILVLGGGISAPNTQNEDSYRETRDKIQKALIELYDKIRVDEIDT